ncbi:type II toxin-antitoxin system HicB family antitoxin [Levilactobacillus cerevisiae]|uniref:type II toxin-antitoxin system HicB family antitoxin n=1 Tax=Levilactobacillus cerevisiae TaxID=1704076 RepID=UPI001CDD8ACB|nr:type II toxin-antitoxin system HicB family antitoxin [Levilactobacillus cerevisiae]
MKSKSEMIFYPAVFIRDAATATVTVVFPDVPSAISQAATMDKAITNAAEVLGLMLYDEVTLPKASALGKVKQSYPTDQVRLIAVDLVQAAQAVTAPLG